MAAKAGTTLASAFLFTMMSAAAVGGEERSGVNNVVDCAQLPAADAELYLDQFAEGCDEWARRLGYQKGVLLPRETAASDVTLGSDSMTCPAATDGTVGYFCVGMHKLSN